MSEAKKYSAIDIKKLYDADPALITADLTPYALKTLLGKVSDSKSDIVEIENVHQDTWSIEEAEASQEKYKNQLNGLTYRTGAKTMGDVTFNFTIGQYDFATKARLMGGTASDGSWKRSRETVDIKRCLIALTEDDVYCVLPKAEIATREGNTDGAIGLATVGTMLLPDNTAVAPEYWFDKDTVDKATTA